MSDILKPRIEEDTSSKSALIKDELTEFARAHLDTKTGTILVDLVDPTSLSQDILDQAVAEGFTPKNKKHLTILGFKQGKMLANYIKQNPEIAEAIIKLLDSTNIDIQPTGEGMRLSKQFQGEESPRESIIEMVSCEQIPEIINQINQLTGLALVEQPPHITIATKGNPQGIGINSQAELEEIATSL